MISIAMTTYNGEKFVSKQIESILKQTYQEFELIVCDDNSSDETISILEEFQAADTRVHIFKNDKNLGFKKNFEKAISLCNGEYIALADQDDIWEPKHLEILYNSIGDNYLACGDAIFIDSTDSFFENKKKLSDYNYDLTAITSNMDVIKRILYRGNPYQGASMLLSRDFLSIAMPIPENCPYHDVWFALVDSIFDKFSYTSEIVNNYRLHQKSVTSHNEKKLFEKIIAFPRFSKTLIDRFGYVNSALTLYENKIISEEVKEFVCFSREFFSNLNRRVYRLKNYKRFKNDILRIVYKNNSYKFCFYKLIQYLFF